MYAFADSGKSENRWNYAINLLIISGSTIVICMKSCNFLKLFLRIKRKLQFMNYNKFNFLKSGRREFLSKMSLAAALSFAGKTGLTDILITDKPSTQSSPQPAMPMISLGPHRISRLICGCNPMLGYSYLGAHTDRQMKEYFTPERIAGFLKQCEQAGINAHQSSSRSDYFGLLHEQGTGLKILSLQSKRENIPGAIESARPIAIVHHGGVSDRLFAEGKSAIVHDFVKEVKDKGLLAGVSAHNPDVVKQIADEGWDVDFFMTCFYFLTRKELKGENVEALPVGGYNFMADDPKAMTAVIRQVNQPCLAFKILGAGRRCSGEDEVHSAFQFAFENIKPSDGVIVGMFPWFFDEISANVSLTKELGVLKG